MKREQRRITRDQYLAEMEQRFGPLAHNWKCQCPVCGIIYTLGDCGTNAETTDRGAFGCIGRFNGKGGEAFGEAPPNKHGCNFAANGLFRSPWLLFQSEVGVGEATGIMPIAPETAGEVPSET